MPSVPLPLHLIPEIHVTVDFKKVGVSNGEMMKGDRVTSSNTHRPYSLLTTMANLSCKGRTDSGQFSIIQGGKTVHVSLL